MAGVVYAGLLWQGYQRRKETWNRRSWILFGISLLAAFLMLGVALRMATGVDNGIYNGMSHRSRSLYFYTMFAVMLIGIAASAGLALSFARGHPRYQFGRTFGRIGGSARSSTADLQQTQLRDNLHDGFVLRGYMLVAQTNSAESLDSWEREYVRDDERVRLRWNSDTWLFSLITGSTFQRTVVKTPSKLSGAGLDDFLDQLESPKVRDESFRSD
jgi:hypothetical protein